MATVGHSVKLVQLTHAPVVVLQTRPAFAPTHPAVLQLKPGGGGGPGGTGVGVAAATQAPFRQVVAVVAPGIEHNVPFGFGLHLQWFFVRFFFLHWPHFFLHLASASSGAANPTAAASAPTASPRRAVRRLTRVVAMLLISWSNVVPSMTPLHHWPGT